MRRTRRVVDEPRLLRIGRRLGVDLLDGVVGHRGDQVPTRLAVIRMDRRCVAEQVARLPLAGIAADEAIEVVVAQADGPSSNGSAGIAVQIGTLWFLPNQAAA